MLDIFQGGVQAKALQKGAKTPMIARSSTAAGELGAADAERDLRGLALKFYTEEGNRNLVGNNSWKSFRTEQLEENYRTRSEKKHGRKD